MKVAATEENQRFPILAIAVSVEDGLNVCGPRSEYERALSQRVNEPIYNKDRIHIDRQSATAA